MTSTVARFAITHRRCLAQVGSATVAVAGQRVRGALALHRFR